jgi:hypothetical protein
VTVVAAAADVAFVAVAVVVAAVATVAEAVVVGAVVLGSEERPLPRQWRGLYL